MIVEGANEMERRGVRREKRRVEYSYKVTSIKWNAKRRNDTWGIVNIKSPHYSQNNTKKRNI